MAVFLSWLQGNWAAVVGIVGMICGIGSLLYTAAYFRDDSRQKQFLNLETMSARHDALWKEAEENPKLERVRQVDGELSTPPTPVEHAFLVRVIIHYQKGWRVLRTTDKEEFEAFSSDAAEFFSRPLAWAVWQKEKKYRSRGFVRFIGRALDRAGHLTAPGTWFQKAPSPTQWRRALLPKVKPKQVFQPVRIQGILHRKNWIAPTFFTSESILQ